MIKHEMDRWDVYLTDDEIATCIKISRAELGYRDNAVNRFGGQEHRKMVGAKGELAVGDLLQYLGVHAEYGTQFGVPDKHDYKLDNGKIISVKTQYSPKHLTNASNLYLNCGQATKYRPDYLVFAYNFNRTNLVTMLGWVEQFEFVGRAQLIKTGDKIPYSNSKNICEDTMYLGKVGFLKPITEETFKEAIV